MNLYTPRINETQESSSMPVNMTHRQKIAFEKYLSSMDRDSDSESETETLRKEEACPYGCKYKTGANWLMKAHIKKCSKNDDNESSQTNTSSTLHNDYSKYLVKSYQRTVKATVDDNLNYLCSARFWPIPASNQAIFAAMPSKAEPVRTNYNSSDWGLTINNHKTVLAMHDKTNTSLTLKMFTDHSLAKHEENLSWKPGPKATTMIMNDEYEDIKKPHIAMQALNNFRTIYQKIWPLDSSVETLFNVVWRQTSNASYPPQVQDISELFAYWIQERAQAALESRPPMSYFNLQSHLNSLCQRRGPSTTAPTNIFKDRAQANNERNSLKITRKGFNKGRQYERPYDKERQNKTVEDSTCILFNSPSGCPKNIPNGGSCSNRFGTRWLHVCNYYDNATRRFCMEPHNVMDHK